MLPLRAFFVRYFTLTLLLERTCFVRSEKVLRYTAGGQHFPDERGSMVTYSELFRFVKRFRKTIGFQL